MLTFPSATETVTVMVANQIDAANEGPVDFLAEMVPPAQQAPSDPQVQQDHPDPQVLLAPSDLQVPPAQEDLLAPSDQ